MRTNVLKYSWLILILAIASILRLYRITELPALNADEAAIGYNAYSLIQTGKDEHGNPWPLHFQSFNDYKPGLYFYLVLPFVKVLGLSELAVRLPGALFGVGTVLMVYFLVCEMFKKWEVRRYLALLTSFFLAISPWHLHFSRGGWEVNVATFFITAGSWLFLKGLRNDRYFAFCLLPFTFALYTYHAARIVVPVLGLGLLVIYRSELLKRLKTVLTLAILSLLLVFPLAINLAGPAGLARASGVGLFADTGPFWRANTQRGQHGNPQSSIARILHNRPVNYGLAFLENYFQHFSGSFLFFSGDEIQRNKVPGMGQMYLFDILFVGVGLIGIARVLTIWRPLLLWLLIAPIPAALTFQSPHALRSQSMVVPLVIISAFGAINLLQFMWTRLKARKNLLVTCYLLLVTFIVWDFTRYLDQYYTHMAKTYEFSSQYGVKELVQYVAENKEKYSKVIVTDRYDQPYILFLFYLKYPPQLFQGDHRLTTRDKFGFSTVREFDKFLFQSLEWNALKRDYRGRKVFVAGTGEEIPEEETIKTIYFPGGGTAFRLAEI